VQLLQRSSNVPWLVQVTIKERQHTCTIWLSLPIRPGALLYATLSVGVPGGGGGGGAGGGAGELG
jgi:hypothetical protein